MAHIPGIPRKEFFLQSVNGDQPVVCRIEPIENVSIVSTRPLLQITIDGEAYTVEEEVLETLLRAVRDSRLYLAGYERARALPAIQ